MQLQRLLVEARVGESADDRAARCQAMLCASTANMPCTIVASSAAAGPFPETSPINSPHARDGSSIVSKKSPPMARHGRESPTDS